MVFLLKSLPGIYLWLVRLRFISTMPTTEKKHDFRYLAKSNTYNNFKNCHFHFLTSEIFRRDRLSTTSIDTNRQETAHILVLLSRGDSSVYSVNDSLFSMDPGFVEIGLVQLS